MKNNEGQAHLNRNANEIGITIYERDEAALQTTILFLSSPARCAVNTRYSVVEAETTLTFHPFFSFFPFFHLSIIVTPWRIPRSLAARVRASACSFRFARNVPGISSGFNVRRQGISKVIESSTPIRRVLKTAILETDRRPKDPNDEDYVKPIRHWNGEIIEIWHQNHRSEQRDYSNSFLL